MENHFTVLMRAHITAGLQSCSYSSRPELACLVASAGVGKAVKDPYPQEHVEETQEHARIANERIHRRLEQGKSVDHQRNDFMTYILRHNDEKGMSIPEIEATMRILVLAGNETTFWSCWNIG